MLLIPNIHPYGRGIDRMLISVTAPRKGMGQTLTAVQLAAALTKYTDGNVLLLDLNHGCGDLQYYTWGEEIPKGVDDFYGLWKSGLISERLTRSCIREAVPRLHVIGPPRCYTADREMIEALFTAIRDMYSVILVDTSIDVKGMTPMLQQSDAVIMVVQPTHTAIKSVEKSLLPGCNQRILPVVNRFQRYVSCSMEETKHMLEAAGISGQVFCLDQDDSLLKECNAPPVVNYALYPPNRHRTYVCQIHKLAREVLTMCGVPCTQGEDKNGWIRWCKGWGKSHSTEGERWKENATG